MKRNRIILIVLWLLSLVGISLQGGPVTYGIFYLLTLIPLFSLAYIGLVIYLFKIYQAVEGLPLVANHPTDFYFVLQNESWILFSGIQILFYSSFSSISGLYDETEYELHPGSGIRRNTRILCRYRGEYEIGIKTIEVRDFFRLFTVSYRNREPYKARVRPAIVHLSRLKASEAVLSSSKDSLVNRSEIDLLMKEYESGDDPRLINWKASSANGKLMVRQRIGEEKQGAGILMDPHRYSDDPHVYLPIENKILEIVIALSLFLSEKGIPVETFWYDEQLRSAKIGAKGDFRAFYETMCGYSFKESCSLSHLCTEALHHSRIAAKRTVFLVLHSLDSGVLSFMDQLAGSDVDIIVYAVGDETMDISRIPPGIRVVRVALDADPAEVL